MEGLLWVCIGSGVGGGARHLISGWMLTTVGPTFPFGTLLVNVSGSFLLAALAFVGLELGALPTAVRLGLTTGLLGGFTTYSTFSYESLRLLQQGSWGLAVLYLASTVGGGLAASLLGWSLARWLFTS